MTTQIVNSKFKKLVVSGCSFTHNNHHDKCAWANLLADWSGMTIVNLATPGAGNEHIANSLILYLEKNKLDPSNTLVMAMWSGIDRNDLIVSRKKYKIKTKHNTESYYDQFTEHFMLGGVYWNKEAIPKNSLVQEYNSMQDEKSLSMKSWLNFDKLTNYLTVKNYTYRYTTFTDILKNGSNSGNINFLKELSTLDLSLNLDNWILTDKTDSLGEFTLYHDERIPGDGHPTVVGQERWVKEKLIPLLINQGILINDM